MKQEKAVEEGYKHYMKYCYDEDYDIKTSFQITAKAKDEEWKEVCCSLKNMVQQQLDFKKGLYEEIDKLNKQIKQLQNQLKNCSEANLDLINKGKELEKDNEELIECHKMNDTLSKNWFDERNRLAKENKNMKKLLKLKDNQSIMGIKKFSI